MSTVFLIFFQVFLILLLNILKISKTYYILFFVCIHCFYLVFLFFIECFPSCSQSILVYFGDQTETVFIKKYIFFCKTKTLTNSSQGKREFIEDSAFNCIH
ncbi:hypothetical protein P7951_26 [Streptococcus phage P7951]|uniref:Uncharacterized protein n=1 Tax=Streptococcus phage P7951 TaxID=1971436 RepID=A0A286QQL7_9CAUD|nr:hypothetical protein PQF01_gp26 [Streptococcus phage P7951]ARU14211.1 hypothetical protein P7951_26 [Streptococcus phage P7951]